MFNLLGLRKKDAGYATSGDILPLIQFRPCIKLKDSLIFHDFILLIEIFYLNFDGAWYFFIKEIL